MFRFLPGIIMVQTATAVLVYAALKTPIQEYWVTFGVIGLITGVLARQARPTDESVSAAAPRCLDF